MKRILLFLIILITIPLVFADITIKPEQNIYNLGNKIKASASVMQTSNFEGLFKLTLSCGNYKLQYFLTPISLEANFRTAINVPELSVTPSMLGNCTISGELLTNDNAIIEGKESDSFTATNQLIVLPVQSRITALPSETIVVAGVINEAFGNNILKASAGISMDDNAYDVNAVDGKFNLTLRLPKNIKSGKHTIGISTLDSKNNFGSSSIELEITAVPVYIKIALNEDKLMPGSKIEIAPSLYDQADDLINASLDLELRNPAGSRLFKKVAQSNEKIEYEFSQYAEPGIYVLASAYNNLLAQAPVNLSAVREVKIKYENENVFIENIGNVLFDDELTFLLENELKKYPITKKIKIEPGKILSFDLSKEVPSGIYNVILPVKKGLEPIKAKINETIRGLLANQANLGNLLPENKSILASDVTIHDNRPIYKKIGAGIASISTTLVGADGVLSKNPVIAPLLLIAVLLLIILRYGRKPLIRLIRGKKEEKKDENKGGN